jgi:hypothetical protein
MAMRLNLFLLFTIPPVARTVPPTKERMILIGASFIIIISNKATKIPRTVNVLVYCEQKKAIE